MSNRRKPRPGRRHIDINGWKIPVTTQAEFDEAHPDGRYIHLVTRVEDNPYVPTHIRMRSFHSTCSRCQHAVWVDPKSMMSIVPTFLCVQCIAAERGVSLDGTGLSS